MPVARWLRWAPVITAWMLAGCARQEPAPTKSPAPPPAVRITQFYTTTPKVARGEKGMVCYGVENAKTVWLSPPKRELSAALARCVEVEPSGRVTYTLTAEGADGKTATQDLALSAGPARVHIVNVDISAAEANPGDTVSLCYKVENAQSVAIEPVHFRGGSRPNGCVTDQPRKTTTYVVTATGGSGDTDQEKVTIKVGGGR